VERLDDEAWAGVASVDRGTQGLSVKDTLILAGGDIGALITFATIGRMSHGESLAVVELFGTAGPFILGWVGASMLFTGGYGKNAIESPLKTTAATWATGIPAGLLVRSLVKGHLPETTFIMVSMAFTGVILVGWRSVFVRWIAKPLDSSLSAADQLKKRQNKRGNPFEFISLLLSLVKRW
jgi:divalent metal cation (Fe/Co/Zn/Cd) transporter